MTTPGGPTNGGGAARRALIRWAGRMFRREWRRQVLVIALLAVAVAAATGSVTLVYNASPADDAELGSASTLLRFDASDPRKLEAGLAAAERSFGTTDVIGHRSLAVPGGVETVDFRAQDPDGPYGGELLALRRGGYPVGPDQVAVTDGVAKLLRLDLGSTLALDGRRRTVAGIVENPRKLSDEFALVAPTSAGAPEHVSVLVDASAESVASFIRESLDESSAFSGSEERSNDRTVDTLAMFSVATVFLLLASLIAAAGFAVVAQRRLRHLGMLAAIGATQKQLRLALLANGAIVGAIAAVCGTVAGLALWLAVAPTLESAVGHRIDRLSVPWPLIAAAGVLAIVGAAAAAWWPARTIARLPVMLALSGRPPRPRPARHAAFAASALLAVGVGSLALSGQDRATLIVVGIVATILGTLLLGPLAIRAFSGVAGRLPIAPRLALRDLGRYQARSGAALAAVTLALGIAAAIAVIASAEHAKEAAEPPNLSDRQIRVYMSPPGIPGDPAVTALAQHEPLAARVGQLAAELDGAAVLPLSKPVRPEDTAFVVADTRVLPTLDLARPEGSVYHPRSQLYVATPAVLRHLGIDPAGVDPGTDFLADPSVPTGELVIPGSPFGRGDVAVANVQRFELGDRLFGDPWDGAAAASKPTFVTLDGLRRHGFDQVPAGWLVESSGPLTNDEIADARELAAQAGLTVEVRREASSPTAAMAVAIGAGALLALGILAMTVGLIRGESAGDLRTLTATGAGPRVRRTLTATTAGALAFLGAVLGVAGAYAVLTATFYDDLGYLSDVPVLSLALAVVGVPLLATAAGWVLAGREPPVIARAAIE